MMYKKKSVHGTDEGKGNPVFEMGMGPRDVTGTYQTFIAYLVEMP